jgi:hypothetical protein
MKKILETLKLKWAEYLLEIMVIVIGIIVAFNLDAWHNQNLQEDRLITILKKTQLNIQPITERNPQQMFLRHIDTILTALDIIETKSTITKKEEGTISRAIGDININGMRSYNLHSLEQLIENLPVVEANLPLINATEELINKVNGNLYVIKQMNQQLFDMMTLINKEIVWFNREGSARFDYKALRESRQSTDYLIRGRRWKKWIGIWDSEIVNKYKEVNVLIVKRLSEQS